MGLKNIAIAFPAGRTVYYAGEVILGCCEIEVDDDPVPYIELSFTGGARVHWTERRSRTTGTGKHRHTHYYTVHYSAAIPFFSSTQNLTNGGQPFTQGKYQVQFQYKLASDLISSMEGTYGYVRYELKAKPPGNWFTSLFKSSAKVRLQVLQLIDTSLPQYNFAVAGTDEKTICCLCCASGPLTIEAKTDRAAYCPGNTIAITAKFANNSSKEVKPYVKLKQTRIFRAQGKVRSTVQYFELEPILPEKETDTRLNETSSLSWESKLFKMPHCFPSLNCVYLPIVVGTVSTQSPDALSAVTAQPTAPPVSEGGYGGAVTNINTAQQSLSIGWQGPWSGTGRQQGHGATPTAPPLPTVIPNIDYAPPSYFEAIMSNEKPELEDDPGETTEKS